MPPASTSAAKAAKSNSVELLRRSIMVFLPGGILPASGMPFTPVTCSHSGVDSHCKNSKGERPWEGALALWGGGIVTGSP